MLYLRTFEFSELLFNDQKYNSLYEEYADLDKDIQTDFEKKSPTELLEELKQTKDTKAIIARYRTIGLNDYFKKIKHLPSKELIENKDILHYHFVNRLEQLLKELYDLRWEVDGLIFKQGLNLLAGKNTSGKSKTLDNIRKVANILNGNLQLRTIKDLNMKAKLEFGCHDNPNKSYLYEVCILESNVVYDNFIELKDNNKNTRVFRMMDIAFAYNNKDQIYVLSHPNPNFTTLYSLLIHDKESYNYLNDLLVWSLAMSTETFSEVNKSELMSNSNFYPQRFLDLIGKPENDFKNAVTQDLNTLGYNINDIYSNTAVLDNLSLKKYTSFAEKDVPVPLLDLEMSVGFIRTFRIVCLVNYLLDKPRPTEQSINTLLLDDIGEGLDFKRAAAIVNLIQNKLSKENIQIIMSTNDDHLMNEVDIDNWNILKREGVSVKAFNNENAKDAFARLKFIGLNNFDLFADFGDSIKYDV